MINQLLGPLLKRLPENNKLERIWVLAKTDFIERYYGTRLGIVWALINPFFQLVVYYYVFTIIFGSEIENFALYLFSGLIIWMFFTESTTKGLSLLTVKKYIIDHININKLNLFSASILSTFMGFSFNFLIYFVFSLFFRVEYNTYAFYALPLLLNLLLLIYAGQLILATLHIFFRDINHFWDMFLLLLFWACPIFYGPELIYEKIPILLYLNPLAGIMVNFRLTFLYGSSPDIFILLYTFGITSILFIISLLLFINLSKKAAETL